MTMSNDESNRNHDVAITRCGNSFVAVPGRLLVAPGDTITFYAIDMDDAQEAALFFPESESVFIGAEGNDVYGFEEMYSGVAASEPLTVADNARPGCYPYAAYGRNERRFAEGGSEPAVIVYRRR